MQTNNNSQATMGNSFRNTLLNKIGLDSGLTALVQFPAQMACKTGLYDGKLYKEKVYEEKGNILPLPQGAHRGRLFRRLLPRQ